MVMIVVAGYSHVEDDGCYYSRWPVSHVSRHNGYDSTVMVVSICGFCSDFLWLLAIHASTNAMATIITVTMSAFYVLMTTVAVVVFALVEQLTKLRCIS